MLSKRKTSVKAPPTSMGSFDEDKRMSLQTGGRVRHPIKPAWGLGEVLTDSHGEKVRAFFVGAGEKTLSLNQVTLDCIPKDEAVHPVLDNLRVPAESRRRRYPGLPESIARFKKGKILYNALSSSPLR
jgi:hypothetical protein